MAIEKDFELLDDYLSNRLNGDEAADFERKLNSDPELRQELNIQQSLIENIRQTRVTELKTMLNNIPVIPIQGGQVSLLTKVGSWVVVTGIVATSMYILYIKNNISEVAKEPAPTELPVSEQPVDNAISSPEARSTTEEVKETIEPVENIEKRSARKSTVATTPVKVKKPGVQVYDPTEEEKDEVAKKYEQEQLEIISKAFVTSSMEVVTENTNRKYTFHYVFKDGKLILYGAFEKHLYEILEFISDEKRTVVLFYKANYYLLDIKKETPTILTPIRDRALLKKLSEYRGKKN